MSAYEVDFTPGEWKETQTQTRNHYQSSSKLRHPLIEGSDLLATQSGLSGGLLTLIEEIWELYSLVPSLIPSFYRLLIFMNSKKAGGGLGTRLGTVQTFRFPYSVSAVPFRVLVNTSHASAVAVLYV